jgi:hypothetical protein
MMPSMRMIEKEWHSSKLRHWTETSKDWLRDTTIYEANYMTFNKYTWKGGITYKHYNKISVSVGNLWRNYTWMKQKTELKGTHIFWITTYEDVEAVANQ